MRSLLSLIIVSLCVSATGGSPTLTFHRAQKLLAFPPPNIPYQEAEDWQNGLKQARVALDDHDFPAALRLLMPFEKHARAAGAARLTTSTFLYLGAAYLGTYRYSEGLRGLLEAKRSAELTADRPNLASILALLSNLYLQMSAFPEAERAARNAMEVCEPASAQMVGLTIQKARLAARAGRLDESIELFQHASAKARELKSERLESVALRNFGQYLFRADRLEEAQRRLTASLELARKIHDPGISSILASLAEVELRRGALGAALLLADQAVDAYRPDRSGHPLWALHFNRARVLAAQGKLGAALVDFRTAVRQIEQSGWHLLPADALRVSSIVGAQEVYSAYVDTAAELYFQTNGPEVLAEVFRVAEANRALALRLTAAGRARLTQRLPAEYNETLALLQAHYSNTYRDDSPASRQKAEEFRLRLTEMEARAGMVQYLAPSPDLATVRRRLSANQVMVSFHLGASRSYVWVVTRDRLAFHALPSRDAITAMVSQFRSAIETNSGEFAHVGSLLYEALLRPVDPLLKGKTHLLLLPGDVLFELPFAALRESAGSPYLVERFTIEILPGAWAVEQDSRRVWSGPFLGVGDPIYNPADSRLPRKLFASSIWRANADSSATLSLPRLPGTASELKACARVIAPQEPHLLLGADATWDRVRANLASHPAIIHFATHVVPSPDSPRESLLALSLRANGEPELLTSELIAAHDVRSRVVVLSGCRSGSGAIKPGEGLMGLTRAWLLAGAQSVLATYWPTLDDTGSLLESFYTSFGQSMPPAQALQAAQRAMITRSDYRAEPRYWASCFISSRGL